MSQRVHALVFRFSDVDSIVAVLGDVVADHAFDRIGNEWQELVLQLLARHKTGDCRRGERGFYYCTFALDEGNVMVNIQEQIETITAAGQLRMRNLIISEFGAGTGLKLGFDLTIVPVSDHLLSYCDFNSIKSALDACITLESKQQIKSPYADITAKEMEQVIAQRAIATYLQCIVAVADNSVVGFEALTRGDLGSAVHRADQLFGSASYFGLSEELEFACIEVALSQIQHIPEPYFLTINTGPSVLIDERLTTLLAQPEFKPYYSRLVFEITEHLPLDDIDDIKQKMLTYTQMGIRFALDDVGCGFFDIGTAEVLNPYLMKLCISVIKQIDSDGVITQEIAQTRQRLDGLGAMTLGEGVEEGYQLSALKTAGVHYYQGYIFDKPEPFQQKLAQIG